MYAEGFIILIIFIATLVLIISERINETAMALFGMALAGLVLYVSPNPEVNRTFQEYMLSGGMAWDAVLFVTATMIIVSVAGSSGMFQFIALFIAQQTNGEPKRVYIAFLLFVFVISMFFDPFPTVLIMGSFTIQVCRALEMDFRPVLMSEIIVANFSSIPSVVGSVQNVVIAYAAQDAGVFDAVSWFIILFPMTALLFVVTLLFLLRKFSDRLTGTVLSSTATLYNVDPVSMIKSRRDFILSVVGVGVLVTGFVLSPGFGVNPSLVAMIVASLMLILSQDRAKALLQRLSWDSVFYLIALFGLVEALSITGFSSDLVAFITTVTEDNPLLAAAFMIWIPGAALAVVDSIPVSVLMGNLAMSFAGVSAVVPLALVSGVNISGYIIPIGDSTNIMARGLSAEQGKPISWRDLIQVSFPLGFMHLVICTVYLSAVIVFGLLAAVVLLIVIGTVSYAIWRWLPKRQ